MGGNLIWLALGMGAVGLVLAGSSVCAVRQAVQLLDALIDVLRLRPDEPNEKEETTVTLGGSAGWLRAKRLALFRLAIESEISEIDRALELPREERCR
ncbi:MAG TPA: hypothetical protein PLV39_13980 [Fimbriimonadaceae bacterium]|jgi:hypothetical protein|nr:hypothetical protein [Fimbriimonadaceae bacterium]